METNATPSSPPPRFLKTRIGILFLAAYSITIWYLIEKATASGALLDTWRQEYAGGGSMKFRTPEGKFFVALAIPYGLLVYPATLAASFALFVAALHSGSVGQRFCKLVLLAAMIAILMRFKSMGVASCALGSL